MAWKGVIHRLNTATDPVAGFEHDDTMATLGELVSCCEARDSGSNDDNVCFHRLCTLSVVSEEQ